jgi:hypothetical protein
LFRGHAVPLCGFRVILRSVLAEEIKTAECFLRFDLAFLG